MKHGLVAVWCCTRVAGADGLYVTVLSAPFLATTLNLSCCTNLQKSMLDAASGHRGAGGPRRGRGPCGTACVGTVGCRVYSTVQYCTVQYVHDHDESFVSTRRFMDTVLLAPRCFIRRHFDGLDARQSRSSMAKPGQSDGRLTGTEPAKTPPDLVDKASVTHSTPNSPLLKPPLSLVLLPFPTVGKAPCLAAASVTGPVCT